MRVEGNARGDDDEVHFEMIDPVVAAASTEVFHVVLGPNVGYRCLDYFILQYSSTAPSAPWSIPWNCRSPLQAWILHKSLYSRCHLLRQATKYNAPSYRHRTPIHRHVLILYRTHALESRSRQGLCASCHPHHKP